MSDKFTEAIEAYRKFVVASEVADHAWVTFQDLLSLKSQASIRYGDVIRDFSDVELGVLRARLAGLAESGVL
jgi:hypothetical protein